MKAFAALLVLAAAVSAARVGSAATVYGFSTDYNYGGDHVHLTDPLNYYGKEAPPSDILNSTLRLFMNGKYAINEFPVDHLLYGIQFTGGGAGRIEGNPFNLW